MDEQERADAESAALWDELEWQCRFDEVSSAVLRYLDNFWTSAFARSCVAQALQVRLDNGTYGSWAA